jgi:hypothetical protein
MKGPLILIMYERQSHLERERDAIYETGNSGYHAVMRVRDRERRELTSLKEEKIITVWRKKLKIHFYVGTSW